MKKVMILMLAIMSVGTVYGQKMNTGVAYGQTKQQIAVYVTGGQEGANDILSASLKEAITKSKDYVAVERTADFLQQLRKEQQYQRTGNVNDNEIARLGRESGAKYVCVAEIMPAQGGDFVTARLIGVENAAVIASADGNNKISDLPTLMRISEGIASQLIADASRNNISSSKKRVAVYVTGISDNAGTNKILGAKLVSAITRSEQYAAMERTDAFLKQLNSEYSYERSGNVDDNQIAALGKQFGVSYVCAAKVSSAYGAKALTVSLIDVETANVIKISKAALTSTDINSVISVTQRVADELMGVSGTSTSRHPAEPEMVFVQGGIFTMGCTSEQGSDCDSDEKTTHQVKLSSYYIGKYEVTQAQWKEIMGSNPSFFEGDDLPVENVSWNDVQEFISRLNAATGKSYRLPTEAEWEYAARGGQSRGYKYSGGNSVGSVAWYGDNSGERTHPVGTKQPNELGIYDMSGNVWEWCQDWYGDYSSSSQTNPIGASSSSNRVDRGGSWGYDAQDVRVSNRSYNSPGARSNNLGFRLACSSK